MRKLHENTESQRQDDAQNATNAGKRHGFSDELKADVAFARANGLAYPNFPRSLSHGHKHDIHNANAAHQQSNRYNANDQLKDSGHNVVKLRAELFRAADAKGIRLVRRDAAAGAQKAANLIFRHA